MKVIYLPAFLRQYKKLPAAVREEAKEKIELFKKDPEHGFLKTYKLKGELKGRFGFFVNYSYRIVFRYIDKGSVALLAIGDHDVYKK